MKQNIKVFALATEKASKIFKCHNDYFQYDSDKGKGYTKEDIEFYHLYATIDETPKEGDYYTNGKVIFKCTDLKDVDTKRYNYLRKVVATNDENLKLYESETLASASGFSLKTEDVLLPQISPEFQIAWVKAMNAGTPIIDAQMEMIDDTPLSVPNREIWATKVPKLNSQNYVTILPVKEKMYTRDEVIEFGKTILDTFHSEGRTKSGKNRLPRVKYDEWAKQNL